VKSESDIHINQKEGKNTTKNSPFLALLAKILGSYKKI
jgi:hypothetical protein